MHEINPILYIFAGNNGSGKSTIRSLIADRLGVSINIDADALARGIDPDHPENHKVSAGKTAIRLARDCIHNKREFSIETTLAGGNAIRLIRDAQANGYEVTMFYVGLSDYHLNIERVAARVKNGGHHIHSEDIIRRHSTSIQNLLAHLHLIDHLVVIDNSHAEGEFILTAERGVISFCTEPLPIWGECIEQELKRLED